MASDKQNLWEWNDIAQKYRKWDPDHERWIYDDDENPGSANDLQTDEQALTQRMSLQRLAAMAQTPREDLTSQQRTQQARQASNRMAQANYRRRLLREREKLDGPRDGVEDAQARKQRSQQTRQSMNAFSALAGLDDESTGMAARGAQPSENESPSRREDAETESEMKQTPNLTFH